MSPQAMCINLLAVVQEAVKTHEIRRYMPTQKRRTFSSQMAASTVMTSQI